MIHLSGKTNVISHAYEMALECLVSGRALKIFDEMCVLQGGNIHKLNLSKQFLVVTANSSGFIKSFNVEQIGIAGILIRAGRQVTTDKIHPTPGIEFHKKIGDPVKSGEKVFTIHGDEPELFSGAENLLKSCYEISLQKPAPHVLIKKVLG